MSEQGRMTEYELHLLDAALGLDEDDEEERLDGDGAFDDLDGDGDEDGDDDTLPRKPSADDMGPSDFNECPFERELREFEREAGVRRRP